MPRKSKDKGYRIEREIVELHKAIGIEAKRVPLSGAMGCYGREFAGDVDIPISSDLTLKAEVKARANGSGFTTLERWLADNDCLFLRRDRAQPLVCVPWRIWQQLITAAKKEA